MSDKLTRTMGAMYDQMVEPLMFLSGMFKVGPGMRYNTEKYEFDIRRGGEQVAIAIKDMSVGSRHNTADTFTNKDFKAPVYDEDFTLNSYSLLNRMVGNNPFESLDFRMAVVERLVSGMAALDGKISRAINLQAAQILQTGKLSLVDQSGAVVYEIDFKPKTDHFPTAGTAWDQTGADPLKNIASIGSAIRANGKYNPDTLIMGGAAWEAFISNEKVQDRFNFRRMDLGTIAPMRPRGNGGTYRGTVEVENYSYDIWTDPSRYDHPQTGESTAFVDDASCIVRASQGRLDKTFGAIPHIGKALGIGQQIVPEASTRISREDADMFTNVFLSPDGKTLTGNVASRPLLVPAGIDTFGCIDTGVASL